MGARHRASRALLLAGVAFGGVAGCLLVSPLDDLPASGGAAHGGAATAGAGHGGKTSQAAASGSSGDAGEPTNMAGAGNASGCQTNLDCARAAADVPSRCRPSDHTCVALKNDLCPIAIGASTDPNAIFFGAFATFNPSAPADNTIVWAHQLALLELSGDNVGGLPNGPKGDRRPLVMVVCSNDDADVEAAMSHLADDLEVPAVIGTLKPGDLRRAYEAHKAQDIFYFSPVAVTAPVVAEEDDDHIWNLLGQPSDLAPTYSELLKRSEKNLRSTRSIDDLTPIKVALITTDDAFDSELSDAVTAVLKFNGLSTSDNKDAGNFKFLSIPSTKPDFVAEAELIGKFEPDIIISAASELFLMTNGLQEQIESDWLLYTKKPRPFYILSPYNAGNLNPLLGRISGILASTPSVDDQQRYVGVSIANAADNTLQNAYATSLGGRFPQALPDSANYYDAIYYLAYAMYGADEPDGVTGSGIARGMQRLLSGTNFNVGPRDITSTFKALASDSATVHVASTLGPPDFNPASGVRPVDGSVFCFNRQKNLARLVTDALRYDRDSKTLVGNSFCISGF